MNTIPKLCPVAQCHVELATAVLEKSVLLSIQDNQGATAILLARMTTYLTQIQLFPKEMQEVRYISHHSAFVCILSH